MLGTSKIMAFAATTRAEESKRFYEGTLGLRLVGDDEFAIVFDANGTMLRIQKVEEHTPLGFTVLGWDVADIGTTIAILTERGVEFERYFWLEQDERGVWTAPGGAQ